MRARRMESVGLVLACLLTAGCTTTTSGRPATSTSGPASTSASTVASAPRSFDLTGVDPCSLIPPDRRPEFGLDQPQSREAFGGQPACTVPATKEPTLGVFFDLRKSVQTAVGRSPNIMKTVTIDGFKIPLVAQPRSSQCQGFVQSGPTQYFAVALNGIGDFSLEELCKRVQPLLKIAIDTLTKLQPS